MKHVDLCRKSIVVALAFSPHLIMAVLLWLGVIELDTIRKIIAVVAVVIVGVVWIAGATVVGCVILYVLAAWLQVDLEKGNAISFVLVGLFAALPLCASIITCMYSLAMGSVIGELYRFLAGYLYHHPSVLAFSVMATFAPSVPLAFSMLKNVSEEVEGRSQVEIKLPEEHDRAQVVPVPNAFDEWSETGAG